MEDLLQRVLLCSKLLTEYWNLKIANPVNTGTFFEKMLCFVMFLIKCRIIL